MRLKIPRPIQVSLLFLPLLFGLAFAIVLQDVPSKNPNIRLQILADFSLLIVIGGTALTVIFLGIWTAWWVHNRSLNRSLAKSRHEAAQARRRFLGRLDHELKNSLTALQAQLGYLSSGFDRLDSISVFSDMSTQIEHIRRLVIDLRKLADLEEQIIDYRPVDIDELLSEVLEATQAHPSYAERRVSINLIQPPWGLPSVSGDRSLLSLACYNLLDNALKFTRAGDMVELRAFEMDNWLVIEVADNGPGISENDLPFIFEELYRGANALSLAGSGLGLALVWAIVERHEGTITVRSRCGQGSVFTVRLPVTR